MKKIFYVFILVTIIISAAGCEKKNTPAGSISDYFPAKTNVYYEYDDNGAGKVSQSIYNLYISGNRIQRIISGRIYPSTEVLEISDGELRLVFGDIHYMYFDDVTSAKQVENILILKEPLALGNTWDFDSTAKCEITSLKKKVSTPAGDYDALEVTITSSGTVQKDYYAKGVGLVKSIYASSEYGDIVMDLQKITESAAYIVENEFYYPDGAGGIASETRSITLNTNSDLAAIFEQEFKKPAGTLTTGLISNDTKINDIKIDWSTATISLDTSSAIDDANKDAVSQTLLDFYGAGDVKFTVNGK